MHKMKPSSWFWAILFLLPALVLFFLYFVYPIVFVVAISLTEWNGIVPPKFVGFQNYRDSFISSNVRLAIRNNIIWALALGIVQITIAGGVALILTRKPRGWRTLRTIYFLPNVISKVAIATMWIALYNAEFGAINALLERIGLEHWTRNWLGETGTALPAIIIQEMLYIGYFMIIILAGTLAIPRSYYEAAQLDGASVFQQEWYITIPMLRGILVTAMTLALAFGLRHFEATFLMTRGGPANSTVVMGVLLYRELGAIDYGHANTIGTMLILIGGVVIVLVRALFGRRDPLAESA